MARKRIYELPVATIAVAAEFLIPMDQPDVDEASGFKCVKVSVGDLTEYISALMGGGMSGTGEQFDMPYTATSSSGNIGTLAASSLKYRPNGAGAGKPTLVSEIISGGDTSTYGQEAQTVFIQYDSGLGNVSSVKVDKLVGTTIHSTVRNEITGKPISYTSGLGSTTASRVAVMNSNHEFVTASASIDEVNALVGVTDIIQTQLDAREVIANKDANFGYAGLDGDGKINPLQLPALAISSTFVVASQVAMLALSVEPGDIAIRTDINETFILQGSDPTNLADWQTILTPTSAVASVFGRTGAVTAQSGDYTTSQVTEGSNLYYTDTRARAAITGTTNRVTVTAGVVDISASYVGQASITTLGTIGTGVWNGTIIDAAHGGTGVNNSTRTITIAGNLATTGAFNVTLAAQASVVTTLPPIATTVAGKTGTMVANYIGYWSDADQMTGSANFTYDGTSVAHTGSIAGVAFSITNSTTSAAAQGLRVTMSANGHNSGQGIIVAKSTTSGGGNTLTMLDFQQNGQNATTAQEILTTYSLRDNSTGRAAGAIAFKYSDVGSGTQKTRFVFRNLIGGTTLTDSVVMDGANTFFGGGITPTAIVHIAACTTAKAQMNLVAGTAPASPNDGDVWREDNTNTGLKIRVNGVTKTITLS